MNDFKTCGCKPIQASLAIGDASGLCFSDSFAMPRRVVLDCKDVTFRLKELEINLSESKTRECLDGIGALIINGVKFVKVENEGKTEGKSEGIRE